MLIVSAILAIFIYGMIAAMLGTILPELSDRFHLSPRQNGTIAFAQALGLIIASVGVGVLFMAAILAAVAIPTFLAVKAASAGTGWFNGGVPGWPTVTVPGKRPCTESKRNRWALVSTGPRSLMATTSMSVRLAS